MDKVVYGAASHGEVQTVAQLVGGLEREVDELWMVVDKLSACGTHQYISKSTNKTEAQVHRWA